MFIFSCVSCSFCYFECISVGGSRKFMIRQFVDQLLIVSSEDPDEQRRSLLLNILLLGLFSLVSMAVIFTIFLPDMDTLDKPRLAIVGSALLGSLAIIFFIGRYESTQLASWFLVGVLIISMAFADAPQEVVGGRVLYMFTIPILMASVLLRPYSSFIAAGLVGLLINIVAFTASFPLNFVAPLGFVAVALVAWLSASSLEQALRDLRTANEELQVRSAELTKTNLRLKQKIVEHKRTEAALAQQAQSLARSNAELQQFAYVASHDLREPLRKVRSFAELLQRRYQGQFDAKGDKYIAYIVDGATRMQALITDLLSYSRVGRESLSLVLTDFNAILNHTLADLEKVIQESGVVITHDSLPTAPADPSQMVQLFQNLLANAIKFRRQEETPRVHIAVEQKDGFWLFAVRDNGIGIEPQYVERIFVIFQRLHTITEYLGTGIGLSICKKIVEGHDGRIWIESEFGQGSTFYFTLPATRSVEDIADDIA
ncbi:MAG: GHKL domain-containing protein [Chloroflexi bacterium]|nr:GHKL domain-containing protein [Chloroflexota bacterium]